MIKYIIKSQVSVSLSHCNTCMWLMFWVYRENCDVGYARKPQQKLRIAVVFYTLTHIDRSFCGLKEGTIVRKQENHNKNTGSCPTPLCNICINLRCTHTSTHTEVLLSKP